MNIAKSILLILFFWSCCCCHNRESSALIQRVPNSFIHDTGVDFVRHHLDSFLNKLDDTTGRFGYFLDSNMTSPFPWHLKTNDFTPIDLDTIGWRHTIDSLENADWIEEHVKSI